MKKLTTEEFIKRARAIHGDKYDYSKVEYINIKTKVCIICPEHGEFWQVPAEHLRGRGCKDCGNNTISMLREKQASAKRPDLSHIETPPGSKAVPVGIKGDYALVDDEDYDRVMEYNWYLTNPGYAENVAVGKMHRFIMNPPDDKVIDHINHVTLDNRKLNLRVCTSAENMRNRVSKKGYSKYKGVSRQSGHKNWVAYIGYDGVHQHLGSFETEEDAAKAYDDAARKHHREFANLNFQKIK